MQRIVVIAENSVWRERTAACFAENGFVVVLDPTGETAFDRRARGADAAIIDWGLAARPASVVLMAWRARSSAPIVAVAHQNDEPTVLSAYAAGADHVASMDVSGRLLLARLRSVLRRRANPRRGELVCAGDDVPVVLDPEASAAVVWGTAVPVTTEEFDFLQLLVGRGGRLVSRSELASFGLDPSSDRAVDFFVRRLREKLEKVDPQRRILVVRGVGFRFDGGGRVASEVST